MRIAGAIRKELRSLTNVNTPSVRTVRRRWSRTVAGELAQTVLAVADALAAGGTWPERVVACELVAARRDVVNLLNATIVERWARGLSDWGGVDLFGITIAGIAWREGLISDERIMRWARSADRWRRRLALVATVPLNSRARGGVGDAARTLRICRLLLDDRDDMVVKALSWALRELAKRDPANVARFIRDEDARLASRVRREVTSKLETGLKSPRALGR